MKIILSLLILLALIGSVRYVTNKPGPVDQELIAKIGDKMDETLSGAVATGTVVDTTANTVASGTTTSGDTTTTTTPTPTAGDTYIISAGSTLGWIGRKVGGEHTGAIAIKSATATVADGKLVGGEVVIDMNTITVIDLPAGEMNDKLVGHLKDGFFSVATNPEAKFVITAVTPTVSGTDIVGDLTLKGVTKSITFPAAITVDPTTLKIQATTYIDKEVFGITEGAGMVDKLFGLVFNLTFTK